MPGAREPVRDQLDLLRGDAADLAEFTGRLAHDASPLVQRAVRSASDRYPAARRLRGAYKRIQARTGRSDTDTGTR